MKTDRHYRARPRRLRRATLLLVGCGDVGQRIAALIGEKHPPDRIRVLGTARSDERAAELRARGIRPLKADLDDRRSTQRLRGLARWMIDLAPPPNTGRMDPRSRRLLAALATREPASDHEPPRRWVYVSTTGVYGDCGGAVFDETRPVAPSSERAVRRVDAETRFRKAGTERAARTSILRVPGIYDSRDRLPIERLRRGTPALNPEDDVHTNHIHADDLAAICWLAVFRGRACRVVHAVDDSDLKMGDYFDQVADAARLPRPPRLARTALAAVVSPMLLSFMSESRRLLNRRLRNELRVRLAYPTVDDTLAEFRKTLL